MIDRILLDMDGVLVDFLGGCKKFHNKEYPDHPFNPSVQTEQRPWNIEPIFGMSAPELWDPLGFDFWRDLEPLPWFEEVIGILESTFGQENICLLTTPIRTEGAIEGKMEWIRTHLPAYRRRFLIGPCKYFCASPRHALVDDHATNIEMFKDAGGHTFLFPSPWNRRFNEHPIKALREWVSALSTLRKSDP